MINPMRRVLLAISWLPFLVAACARAVVEEPPPLAATPRADLPHVTIPPAARPISVDSVLQSLTTRQKIGQLIMPWLMGHYTALDSDEFDRIAYWVDSLQLGGIVISVGSPLDATAKLNALQERSNLPLLIAADLEWGSGMRLVGGTSFPMAMAIGATGDTNDAYELGRVTALEARAAGIHMTFSPVADVNNNPNNPIINTRAFGEDPHEVARLVAAYIRGARANGLFTTAKHFPGHGDTQTDSHIELPVVSACWSRLDSLELVPFRAAIRAGVTAVMTAHVAMPCIDGTDDPPPATLSSRITAGILRDSLGFRGLILTDALSMGAIVAKYGPGESAVQAFLAGNDLILIPADPRAALNAMVTAVESGRVPQARLDASVRKMLQLKNDAGLFRWRTARLADIQAAVGRRDFQAIADDVAQRSLTLIQPGTIREYRSSRGRVALITYAEETNLTIGNTLIQELRSLGDTVNPFRLYPASGPASYDSARTVIKQSPRVVFAMGVRFIAGRGHIQLPDSLAALISMTERAKPSILASLGSPYLLNQIPGYTGAYLLAWSDFTATEHAVARALAGGAPITGHLPISLSERYPRGYGIQLSGR